MKRGKLRTTTSWLVLVLYMIGWGEWHEFSEPITERSKAKTKQSQITSDTLLMTWYAEWVLKHHSMLWISWEINEIFLKDSKDHFHRIAYKEFKSNFLLLTLDVCYDWLTEKKKDSFESQSLLLVEIQDSRSALCQGLWNKNISVTLCITQPLKL